MYSSHFKIGDVSVCLGGVCGADVALSHSLEPFRVDAGTSDIFVQVEWVADLVPPERRALFDSGAVWRLYADDEDLEFDFSTPIVGIRPYKRLIVDDEFRRARLLLSVEYCSAVGALPLGYPLDEVLILHRLTQEKAIELHGCGIVGPDGESNLFVGHSGAGKSTTTQLWTASQDVLVLSDDRIIVRRPPPAGLLLPARTEIPRSARDDKRIADDSARNGSASRTSPFAQDDKGTVACADQGGALDARLVRPQQTRSIRAARSGPSWDKERPTQDDKATIRMYGTPWHGEAQFASPESAPLGRICILEHGHGNVLTPLSPSQAVAELFARAFVPFHRHEYIDSALVFLEEVANAIPCYRFAFEPNQGAVEAILNLHD